MRRQPSASRAGMTRLFTCRLGDHGMSITPASNARTLPTATSPSPISSTLSMIGRTSRMIRSFSKRELRQAIEADVAREVDRHARHPQAFGVDFGGGQAEGFVRGLGGDADGAADRGERSAIDDERRRLRVVVRPRAHPVQRRHGREHVASSRTSRGIPARARGRPRSPPRPAPCAASARARARSSAPPAPPPAARPARRS